LIVVALFSAAATSVCLQPAAQPNRLPVCKNIKQQEAEGERHMFFADNRIAARREQAEPDENAQEKAAPSPAMRMPMPSVRHPTPPIAHLQMKSSPKPWLMKAPR
jgi:hypothetical protein